MNVRVHRKGRHAESLTHHNRGGLVPHPRQLLELRKGLGDATRMLLKQDAREARNRLRLLGRQPTRPNDRLDLRHRDLHHGRGGIGQRPERRRN